MVVHFKDKDPETGETTKKIPLHKPNDQSTYLEQISTYVHQKGSMLKKVELFWPHELLQVIGSKWFFFVGSEIRIYYASSLRSKRFCAV